LSYENFDAVSAPALPAGWTTATTGVPPLWRTSTGQRDSLPNAAYCTNAASTGATELVTPVINLSSSGGKLTFRHFYNLESGYDGGVLEIKIGAGAFADILAAGGSFSSGGYNRTLNSSANPLSTRQAWSGNSAGFVTTVVNLPAAANGQPIQLKWRCGSDSSVSAPGWYVDSLTFMVPSCCVAPPTLLDPHLAADGRLVFTLSGAAGYNYQIENSTDLYTWSAVAIVTNPSGQISFTQTNAPGEPIRVYRARRLP
jgi:hypothetical protein